MQVNLVGLLSLGIGFTILICLDAALKMIERIREARLNREYRRPRRSRRQTGVIVQQPPLRSADPPERTPASTPAPPEPEPEPEPPPHRPTTEPHAPRPPTTAPGETAARRSSFVSRWLSENRGASPSDDAPSSDPT